MRAASSDAKGAELRSERNLPTAFRSSEKENKRVQQVPMPVFPIVLEDVSRLPWIPLSSPKLLKNKIQ